MSAEINASQEGAVLTLTLDRPAKKNALTLAMYEALAEGLNAAAAEPSVKVVVLRGAGGAFTAGNDLNDFMRNPPKGMDSPVGRFLLAIRRFPKPLIAAVEGVAIGVGTTLLLHCDLVYAAEDARLSMPFTKLALAPEAGASFLLPLMVGHRRAAELLLFGEPFDAATARELGLVNAVVPAAELAALVASRAAALAALPPASLRESKRLLKAPFAEQLDAVMMAEGEVFTARLRSPELAEAITAFFQKREPNFTKFS